MSCIMSEGITPHSRLIWAHEPDQRPLPSFGVTSSGSPCRLLPVPAGSWPFPMLSPQSVYGCKDPYPAASSQCFYPLLPGKYQLHPICEEFSTLNNRHYSFCDEYDFGAAVIPLCSSSHTRSPPGLYLPLKLRVFKAAETFTPRNEHVVTHHELWYRYMHESGNLHDRTFTC